MFLNYLERWNMVHVCCLVEESCNLCNLKEISFKLVSPFITKLLYYLIDNILVYLFTGHNQKKTFKVVWGNLVEDYLDVELVVQSQWVVPDRATEDQVVDSSLLV